MKSKFTKKIEEEIVQLYSDTRISTVELGRRYGCSYETIRRLINRYGKRKSRRETSGVRINYTKEFEQRVINLYLNSKNITSVTNNIDIKKHMVMRILRENNIPIKSISESVRKYEIDHSLFDKIDTKEKAIFLGLFFADGCNRGNGKSLNISLAEEDKLYLQKFSKILFNNRPLIIENQKRENRQNMCKLEISSEQIIKNIETYGGVPRKSLILEWPKKLNDNLIPYFLRGYFDGDGSIKISNKINTMKREKWDYVYKLINYQIAICGSKKFLETLKEILESQLDINCQIYQPKNNKIHYLEVGGHRQVEKFLDFIYCDNLLCLDRKYRRYLEFKDFMKSGNPKLQLVEKIIKQQIIK